MNDNQGFLMFVGIIVISICIGNLYLTAYGFLTLGIGFILMAILDHYWSKKKGK